MRPSAQQKLLALLCCVVSFGVGAEEALVKGKLLVASHTIRSPDFAETVILLLHHDESGALGLIVNRPTTVPPAQVLPQLDGLAAYRGALYWGGPVELYTMRALLLSDAPPDEAVPIFGNVHLAPLDEHLLEGGRNASNLRFYIGYAGWAAGQLEQELALGSWLVLPGAIELVFAEDPHGIWPKLAPGRLYRAELDVRAQAAHIPL